MEGSDTLSLRHFTELPSVSACIWSPAALSLLCIYSNCLFTPHPQRWKHGHKTKTRPKTYKLVQWKVGWVLWCQWPLIKCACGWKRNVCMVFALCPPQANVLPEALCIFLTLPPHTLWLRSYPQPASTSDPRAKRPSIIFLSPHFCFRGYFWHLNLLTLTPASAKKSI